MHKGRTRFNGWLRDQPALFFAVLGGALISTSLAQLSSALAVAVDTFWPVWLMDAIGAIALSVAGWHFAKIARDKEDADKLYGLELEKALADYEKELEKTGQKPAFVAYQSPLSTETREGLRQNVDELMVKGSVKSLRWALLSLVIGIILILGGPSSRWSAQQPVVHIFSCEPSSIGGGEGSRLSWVVEGAKEVYLNDQPVPLCGLRDVAPDRDTHYLLQAVNGKQVVEVQVTVQVQEPAGTPTPMPSPRPTATPTPGKNPPSQVTPTVVNSSEEVRCTPEP